MYEDWIKSRLPKSIPDNVIRTGVNFFGYYASGLQVWMVGERGPDKLLYTAADEDDLKLWFFEEAACSIAQKMELMNRAKEERKWRYVEDHVRNGAWMYRENKKYKYNGIHDSRKYWMEYELRLLYRVFPRDRWLQKIEHYEDCMNHWFTDKHWKYSIMFKRFIEISNSKQVDWNGVEQPESSDFIIPNTK